MSRKHRIPPQLSGFGSAVDNYMPRNRLFVYGIFLSEGQRQAYGMSHPEYATVKDYVTFGERIVKAVRIPDAGTALTGLTVDMDPNFWGRLDGLEHGYDRIKVTTTDGEELWMYAAPEKGIDGQAEQA